MDTSIIIISYNTEALTVACIESLLAAVGTKEIFVVDNASTDQSVAVIGAQFPSIRLIANNTNRGFGAANNQALKECRGRYIIFLNPDTVVKPDTLQNAVTFMDLNRHIGLAGAKILNHDGTLQESVSYKYPGEKFTSGETSALHGNIACVLGAFMIARRALIDELHGFDEDFFLYGEDQDLAWRIREKGFSLGYIEDAEVLHWGGQSETGTPPVALFEKKIKAEYLFYAKHYKPETIARIKKAERLKAVFRLITLKISLLFSRKKTIIQNKIDRYMVALNMTKKQYINDLINERLFRFDHLLIDNIDNEQIARLCSYSILREEFCLFANTIANGNEYCKMLHNRIINSLQVHKSLPIARFADGEYAFYNYTLGCNGLYKQAESVAAIKSVISQHISAMKYVETNGLLAPLVFPGNSDTSAKSIFSFRQKKRDSSGADFLNFLYAHDIKLNVGNYVPFYVIYAYLSSAQFATVLNEKKICILNSEYNKENCRDWFAQFNSHPHLTFVDIPAEYVATRWEESKKGILDKIPPDTVLCLAGAGVGALLICADVARSFSIPVIDAGHVLNMMNGRVDKSNGARLYTLRKKDE